MLVDQDRSRRRRRDESPRPLRPTGGCLRPHAASMRLDRRRVDGLVLEVLADVAKTRVELGARVRGVVRIVEIDGDERPWCADQSAKTVCVHGCPLLRLCRWAWFPAPTELNKPSGGSIVRYGRCDDEECAPAAVLHRKSEPVGGQPDS